MVIKSKTYTKNCSSCGGEQSYGRLDHYKSAIRGDWLCRSCSNKSNNKKEMFHDIPTTWYRTKEKSGISRGYLWDLTIEFIWELYEEQGGVCALSGIPIGWNKNLTATASIDRIDSSEGYLKGNVQLVHKDINFMKQQYDQDKFIALCKSVADHSGY